MADENNQERINDFLAEGGIAMVSNNNQSLTKNNSEAMLRATSTVSTIAKKNTTNNATTISTTAASHYNHSANETMGKLPSSELQCDPSYTAITLKTTKSPAIPRRFSISVAGALATSSVTKTARASTPSLFRRSTAAVKFMTSPA